MGSRSSSIWATVYMDNMERRVLNTFTTIGMYSRYVDDIFIMTLCEAEADEILRRFNNADPNLSFQLEKPMCQRGYLFDLSLLDFKVTVNALNGERYFTFYRKHARKPLFIHYKSAVSLSTKISAIRNEKSRISQRCSDLQDNRMQQENFNRTLRNMDYPEHLISTSFPRPIRTTNNASKRFYFRLPFINDKVNRDIKNIFIRENLPFVLAQKSHTLSSFFRKPQQQLHDVSPKCALRNCLNNDTKICLKSR